MPVPKSIAKGETVTIRCIVKPQGNYKSTQYYIRYFQFDGKGKLMLGDYKALKPNDSYSLTEQQFRLYYVSESNVTQAFDVWISNNHGNEQKVSFQFNAVYIGDSGPSVSLEDGPVVSVILGQQL